MSIRLFLILITAALGFVACQVNKRDPQTPAPTIKRVSTDFFFRFSPDRRVYKSRRFLFGMMAEDKTGRYRNFQHEHYNPFGSANVEFEFNEEGTQLIGRLVNPTYPDNKDKWTILLTFNVSRSYYEENRVDPSGRTSNDIIQRSDRSDPKARPFIDIDLSSMQVHQFQGVGLQAQIAKKIGFQVEDVEWEPSGRFLGFTITSLSQLLSSESQTVDRVNLLRIDPEDGSFEETPYHKDNDIYTQMVYVQSERPNHFGEKLRVAHWDINPNTKNKHKIYIHNFPKEYEQVAMDSIESWNDVFEKPLKEGGLGFGYRPLEYEISNRKYAFDLRYHTLHWVDDIRLSAVSHLGLANIAADINSGKVLWTGAIIWGGLIDQYAGMDIPSLSLDQAEMGFSAPYNINHAIPHNTDFRIWNRPNAYPGTAPGLGSSHFDLFLSYLYSIMGEINHNLSNDLVHLKALELNAKVQQGAMTPEEAEASLSLHRDEYRNSSNFLNKEKWEVFINNLQRAQVLNQVDLDQALAELHYNPITWDKIVSEIGLKQNEKEAHLNLRWLDKKSEMYKSFPKEIRDNQVDMPTAMASFGFDIDERAIEVLSDVGSAVRMINQAGKPIDVFAVKKVMIRKTLVHEIGHSLGLAHNFKSNILPEKGSVPNSIYSDLKAKAEKNMTNKSSIMGYPAGLTVVLTDYEDMSPGVHDIHRLRYLYGQEYPMYDKMTNGESEYVWRKLDVDGRINSQEIINGKVHTPGYLPGCNDTQASFYLDPYCNRHDRGYNAQTLAQHYFESYEDALFRMLESHIESLKSRDYKRLEQYLWRLTSSTLSRTRLFHDYMRLKYADQIKGLKDKNGNIFATYKNILNFSKNCRLLKGKNSSELKELVTKQSLAPFIETQSDGQYKINEFGDLCIATTYYFDNIAKYLEIEGKEYTEIDYFNRRAPGGIFFGDGSRDYSKMYGSWKRMSMLPLKFNIMRSVLLPRALMSTRYGDYLLFPYGRPDTSFSTATLFPEEYLKVIQLLIKSAIHIDNHELEPRISRSLLYLGYFLNLQRYSADGSIIPNEILEAINNQTLFRFSQAFIEVEATKEEGSDYAKSFKGNIYNRFNSSGTRVFRKYVFVFFKSIYF